MHWRQTQWQARQARASATWGVSPSDPAAAIAPAAAAIAAAAIARKPAAAVSAAGKQAASSAASATAKSLLVPAAGGEIRAVDAGELNHAQNG